MAPPAPRPVYDWTRHAWNAQWAHYQMLRLQQLEHPTKKIPRSTAIPVEARLHVLGNESWVWFPSISTAGKYVWGPVRCHDSKVRRMIRKNVTKRNEHKPQWVLRTAPDRRPPGLRGWAHIRRFVRTWLVVIYWHGRTSHLYAPGGRAFQRELIAFEADFPQ